ncbi:hypothetical protein [Bacillus weihaiensis]|uniref:Uncharacterized protein n=1 Tax=Bacillus weihaiensis TaxID=1547283 RepID=A0A1L3MME7_9BACI|nr:hypothetical protein [Bacillus weihaiensis]APH03507.1 hypothetical protein A9C19_01345 [Bacillus weihaiensis]
MKTIHLSIDELLFSFYSEGFFEQGISIKEAYFPSLQDSELKLMLEVASRSLLSKNMIKEVDNQYRLKDEYKSFIQILIKAERTIKASKHLKNSNEEESISLHFDKKEVYSHKVLSDNQVHSISKLSNDEIIPVITDFFQMKSLENESDVFCQLTSQEFEELLEDVSQNSATIHLITDKWVSKKGNTKSILEFLHNLFNRRGKMDSLVSFTYDAQNHPNLMDIYFLIPGNKGLWLITRDNSQNLNVQKVDEVSISNLVLQKKIYSV